MILAFLRDATWLLNILISYEISYPVHRGVLHISYCGPGAYDAGNALARMFKVISQDILKRIFTCHGLYFYKWSVYQVNLHLTLFMRFSISYFSPEKIHPQSIFLSFSKGQGTLNLPR